MLVRFANKFSALVAKYRKRDKFNHHRGKASSMKLTWSTLGRKYNRLNSLKLRLGSLAKKREDVCSDSGKSIFSILDSAGITIFLNHHRTNRRRYLLMQISCPAHRRVQRAFLLNAMISLKLIIVQLLTQWIAECAWQMNTSTLKLCCLWHGYSLIYRLSTR